MAQYVHDRFTSAGVPHVEIQPVDALLSNPISSSLQLVDTTASASDSAAVVFTAKLSEDVLDIDTTSDTWFRNHTYNGCVRPCVCLVHATECCLHPACDNCILLLWYPRGKS